MPRNTFARNNLSFDGAFHDSYQNDKTEFISSHSQIWRILLMIPINIIDDCFIHKTISIVLFFNSGWTDIFADRKYRNMVRVKSLWIESGSYSRSCHYFSNFQFSTQLYIVIKNFNKSFLFYIRLNKDNLFSLASDRLLWKILSRST